ncbi:MAG: hypothetical protein EBQ57_00865 [Actinobacteria bacterium]|nr:hypothetical protein [Actinomycetota bacterium]
MQRALVHPLCVIAMRRWQWLTHTLRRMTSLLQRCVGASGCRTTRQRERSPRRTTFTTHGVSSSRHCAMTRSLPARTPVWLCYWSPHCVIQATESTMTSNRLYYAYARHALVTALKLVRVQEGSSVLVPDFICRDVLASLHAVGSKPRFYTIGDDLQISTTQSLPRAAAIIVVNYFGFPADLQRVREVASSETTIIEDNAHGWLSADRDGTPLGSRTDVGVTSVRKTIRLPDGAFVEWRDTAHLDMTMLHAPLVPRDEPLPLGFGLRASWHASTQYPHSLSWLPRDTQCACFVACAGSQLSVSTPTKNGNCRPIGQFMAKASGCSKALTRHVKCSVGASSSVAVSRPPSDMTSKPQLLSSTTVCRHKVLLSSPMLATLTSLKP